MTMHTRTQTTDVLVSSPETTAYYNSIIATGGVVGSNVNAHFTLQPDRTMARHWWT